MITLNTLKYSLPHNWNANSLSDSKAQLEFVQYWCRLVPPYGKEVLDSIKKHVPNHYRRPRELYIRNIAITFLISLLLGRYPAIAYKDIFRIVSYQIPMSISAISGVWYRAEYVSSNYSFVLKRLKSLFN